MTTTDDVERAERLARLRARQTGSTDTEAIDPPTGDWSPATTAKIVTVGASTTAVLGMMAGYGIADRAAAIRPTLAAETTTAPPPPTTQPPTTTQPPQVIVVLIDRATGLPVGSDPAGLPDRHLLDDLRSGDRAAPGPATTVSPATTAPVPVPVAVDLAVPKPPPPPAPAPAPAPQADSGGS